MTVHAIRVLLVQAEAAPALRIRRRLAGEGEGDLVQVEHATSLKPALERLGKGGVDAVLLDPDLPDGPEIDPVARLRERDGEVPLVVLADARDERSALGALLAGAQDHVQREPLPSAAELHRVLRGAIARQRHAREDRRRCEAVAEGQRMASLGVLCAGVGSALNRLVGTILEETDAAAEALEHSQPAKALRRRLIATRRTALRAATLAEQLRDYAAEHRAPPHPLDLADFVLDTSASLDAVAGGVPVHYDVPAASPIVVAARLPLYQILVGLVRNAAEALEPHRGHVGVAVGVLRARAELLEASAGHPGLEPGVHAFLRVSDNGCGMEPSAQERVFDPFYTTKSAGRGLGLAAVLGNVRALRGRIHVRTARDEGSAFTVLLPLV